MTARGLTAGVLAEITAQELSPIALFEGEFDGGTVRFWTGYGTLSWNGSDWTGGGDLLSWSGLDETDGVIANGTQIAFAGVKPSLVSVALQDARQGLPGRIWIGVLDANGDVIADPYQVFSGILDVPQIQDGEDACTITIDYENRLVDLQKPRELRFTHEGQKLFYPNDLGFEYVTAIQDLEIVWGTK